MSKRLDEQIDPYEVRDFITRIGRLQVSADLSGEPMSFAELNEYAGRLAQAIVRLPRQEQAEALQAWNEEVVTMQQPPHWASQNDTNSFIVHDDLIGNIQRDPDHKFESGAISTLVNHMTPKAQGVWKASMSIAEAAVNGGKIGPFMPFDAESVSLVSGRPESEVRELVREHKMEQVEAGLQKRIGTDSSRPEEPISLRDTISASVDHHEGTTDYETHSSWPAPSESQA